MHIHQVLNKFNEIINDLSTTKNKITILQIGGNDGQQDDFVNAFSNNKQIELHIVEPIKIYYEELKKYYSNQSNVYTYNYAITNTTSVDYINFIPPHPSMPYWLKGCSSFFMDRNILSGMCSWDENGVPFNPYTDQNLISYIKNNTTKLPVMCVTFNDFIKLSNLNSIDILVIDTEGYEYDIIKQINLNQFNISLIILEYHNQSGLAKKHIPELLKEKNYTVQYQSSNPDLLAFKC